MTPKNGAYQASALAPGIRHPSSLASLHLLDGGQASLWTRNLEIRELMLCFPHHTASLLWANLSLALPDSEGGQECFPGLLLDFLRRSGSSWVGRRKAWSGRQVFPGSRFPHPLKQYLFHKIIQGNEAFET